MKYILGGTAPGGKRSNSGCVDRTPPLRDYALDVPGDLYFSARSAIYDGGVAFIDHTVRHKTVKTRAYLIKLEQFWEITRQENGWLSMPEGLPSVEAIQQQGQITLAYTGASTRGHSSKYSLLVHLGYHDGYPLLTFTCPERYKEANAPSRTYVQTLAIGLQESHKMTADEIANYLADKWGVHGMYKPHEIAKIVRPVLQSLPLNG